MELNSSGPFRCFYPVWSLSIIGTNLVKYSRKGLVSPYLLDLHQQVVLSRGCAYNEETGKELVFKARRMKRKTDEVQMLVVLANFELGCNLTASLHSSLKTSWLYYSSLFLRKTDKVLMLSH
ncbi:unnamed protein product [Allacma fusca]|uniref:Uncharacterized protein n=1 Tax=Allacma fusca TaxID=39272 RepID=A0A8J2Q6U3_9HEXA|nr:unnamed protein product [Allacma fusca]